MIFFIVIFFCWIEIFLKDYQKIIKGELQDQSQIGTAWDFVPASPGGWVKFAISANRGGFASLHTACGRKDTKSFHRNNQEMEVKDEDFVTIGKSHILGRAFFVSTIASSCL